MNGIQFIVRDSSGWTPQIAPPTSRLIWEDPTPKPISRREAAFIRSVQGSLPSNDLAECFGVSTQAIRNIWKRRTHTGKRPGPPKKKARARNTPQTQQRS
ncbi:hypothetical protein ACB245_27825 [Achromobacter ruhlandii]|uniref:hypothetical protein n=1 Tax=Achromobacter ruhlandii TaxID=72557 RepID=UPI003558730E